MLQAPGVRRKPRAAARLAVVRPGARWGWLAMGVAGEPRRRRIRTGLPFWRTGRSRCHAFRLERAALWPVHLSDAGALTQGSFCDVPLIIEKYSQQIPIEADTALESLAD
ncbi:hypothetical protein D3C87_1869750 [compost metagenome]